MGKTVEIRALGRNLEVRLWDMGDGELHFDSDDVTVLQGNPLPEDGEFWNHHYDKLRSKALKAVEKEARAWQKDGPHLLWALTSIGENVARDDRIDCYDLGRAVSWMVKHFSPEVLADNPADKPEWNLFMAGWRGETPEEAYARYKKDMEEEYKRQFGKAQ